MKRTSLASTFLLVPLLGTSVFGCANSDTLNTTTGNNSTTTNTGGRGGAGGEGGESVGGFGGGGTTTSNTGGTTGSGGEGGGTAGMGGTGGEGGMGGGGGMPDPCASGCLSGTHDIDNNPLTGECGCEYLCTPTSDADPIDEDFKDDNCDGGDGLVEQCVYVSASQGSNGNPGTRQAPMQTIAAAIAQAKLNSVPAVCLSGEIYNEQVTMESGISLYGGFDQNDADFKFKRKDGIVSTINAVGAGILASQIDVETHISGITLNVTGTVGAGNSHYGIVLGGGVGSLHVHENYINVAAGNDGVAGMDGAPIAGTAPGGADGQVGCDDCSNNGAGGPAPVCEEPGGKGGNGGYGSQTGQAGSPGNGGAAGGPGSGSNACFGSTSTASSGTGGMNGSVGAPGTGGAALGKVVGGMYSPASGLAGMPGTPGKGGGGGGGGGGGEDVGGVFCYKDKGGGGGAGGCGGLAGNLGQGGGGGGGSFGIFVAGGKVVVVNNYGITTGKGGKGGKGGNSTAGQVGGPGGSGGGGQDDSDAGGNGAKGGNGGAAGPGGGGGGGPSACLGYAGGVQVTYGMGAQGNNCTLGLPGLGGAGGTGPASAVATSGSDGTSAASLQIN